MMPLAVVFALVAAVSGSTVGTVPSADGVPIRYEVGGQGSPAVVFVHCWTCDRHFWDHAAARLARDHRVVTLDLAGHGDSGRARKAWTMEAFGEDVKAVVESLGLERVILVGHSMGGPVILEAALRLPGQVVGLIPVDTLLNVEDRASPDQVAAFLAPLRADYKPSAEGFIRKFMFVPGTDPALIERIVRQAGAAPAEAAVAWLEATWRHDDAAAFEKVTVPIRAINADKFPTDREANRRHAPQFDAMILKGLGHYLMLEDPGRFDAALVRAVRDLAAEWAAAGVLQQQVQAWNRGDLEAFCSVYDEDATYASPSGLVRGPAAVLSRYRKRYPDRAAMGTLRLEVLETRAAADPDGDRGTVHGVSILARWRLAYPDKPEASGLTLLVLRPRENGWAIVQDASF